MRTDEIQKRSEPLLAEFVDYHSINLAYQPAMNVASGHIQHIEALARISHPLKGGLPNDELIKRIISQGYTTEFDLLIVGRAVDELLEFGDDFDFGNAPITVNVTIESMRQVDFVEKLECIIREKSIHPSFLMLEVPLELLSNHYADAQKTISTLNELGVKVAFDDFDLSVASIELLGGFQFDCLKVATASIVTGSNFRLDRESLMGFARSNPELASKTIIKNVELLQTRDILKKLGFHKQQGMYFKHPDNLKNVLSWLEGAEEVRYLAALLEASDSNQMSPICPNHFPVTTPSLQMRKH